MFCVPATEKCINARNDTARFEQWTQSEPHILSMIFGQIHDIVVPTIYCLEILFNISSSWVVIYLCDKCGSAADLVVKARCWQFYDVDKFDINHGMYSCNSESVRPLYKLNMQCATIGYICPHHCNVYRYLQTLDLSFKFNNNNDHSKNANS